MSEPDLSSPEANEDLEVQTVGFDRERVALRLARYDQEREAERQKRRAGRPEGVLSDGLEQRLKNCNVAQLERARILCKRLIAR